MSKLRQALSGHLQTRLTLIFLFLGVGLTALVSGYWFTVLEPRLLESAKATAGALAQSQARNLANGLAASLNDGDPLHMRDTMDEFLALTDTTIQQPLISGVAVKLDYETVRRPVGSFDLQRGNLCEECFTTKIPLFSRDGTELLGVATFYSTNAFFEQTRRQVRERLFMVSLAAMGLLLLGWSIVSHLFQKVRASEEAASKAMRARSEFLATMSHEIRTPMNGVMGMLTLLRDTELTAKQHGYIDAIDTSADALLVLIDDILDFSKIEAGKLTLERAPFDARKMLVEIQTLLAARMRDQHKTLALKLNIDPALPPRLMGDSIRIRQILINLLGNAIKFTEHGSVTTQVHVLPPPSDSNEPQRLRFEVIDTGIGIAPDKTEYLFEKFTQADSSITRKFGGTGLGLAICKRLVEAMNGTIGVTSEPGKGSCFYFEIPAIIPEPEIAPVAVAAPIPELHLRPLRVLVAEDGDINRRVATALLQKEGHTVVEAKDGQEALDALAREEFDVVLMDLQMPVMDGLEATQHIRKHTNPKIASLPVIALTANAMKEEQDAALAAGMDGFIAKPFKPAFLKEELTRLCSEPVQE